MIYILLNAVPILAATLAGLVVGLGLWTVTGARIGTRLLVTALVGELWLCSILAGAVILAPARADRWTMGLGAAVIIWAGFVAPALAVTGARRGLSGGAVATDIARWLLVMLVQAAVLIAVGVHAPPAPAA